MLCATECDLYNYINEKQHAHARQTAQIFEDGGKPFKRPSFYSLKTDFLTPLRQSEPFKHGAVASRIEQETVSRNWDAWDAWYKRDKGKPRRKPRYKPLHRFRTLEVNAKYENYLKPAGVTPRKYRITISARTPNGKVVNVDFLIHDKNGRIPIDADGKPKQPNVIRVVQKARRVEAHLVYDVEDAAKILITPESVQAGAGVDMGIKDQAITNDGTFYSKRVVDKSREKRLQRRMNRLRNLALPKAKSAKSRRAKKILAEKERACWMPRAHWEHRDGRAIVVWDTPDGSPTNAYRKTRALYAKEKQRQAEREVNAAYRVSADIVNAVLARGGSVIAVEDLQIQNMLFNHSLARAIAEQGWGRLLQFIKYKAEKAGLTFVEINPAYTSQDCSNMVNGKVCGTRVNEMRNLKRREFECPGCGFAAPRDVNSAANLLARAWKRFAAERGWDETDDLYRADTKSDPGKSGECAAGRVSRVHNGAGESKAVPLDPLDGSRVTSPEFRFALVGITRKGRRRKHPPDDGAAGQFGFASA